MRDKTSTSRPCRYGNENTEARTARLRHLDITSLSYIPQTHSAHPPGHSKILHHVRSVEEVSESTVIVTRSNTRDDGYAGGPMFVTGNTLRLFHEESSDSLVLELFGIAGMDWCSCTIYVLLSVEMFH